MTELLTAVQMRAIEQTAIASGEVTGLELMERAGAGVVEAILEEWPEMAKSPHRAVVLCGPGNNGGDGFVVARLLKQRGWEVEVFLYGDEAKLPLDAAENCRRWREMGEVEPLTTSDAEDLWRHSGLPHDLVVDALFGTGLARRISGSLIGVLQELGEIQKEHNEPIRFVSVDIPSGVCADSGKVLGEIFYADLTVTFHTHKVGHHILAGPFTSDKIVCKSIGLFTGVGFKGETPFAGTVQLVELSKKSSDLAFETESRKLGKVFAYTHKFSHGHALLLSGGSSHTGAIRLASRGALRIGAGLVTIGAHPDAVAEHAAQLNAIMLRQIVNDRVLRETLEDERINALCLGPAMGLNDETRLLMRVALAAKRATVLDADALTMLSREADPFAALHENCVLTPHGGEFARLFPDIAEKLEAPATKGPAYSKVDATREAAKRAGCVVLFKGADTVIASPDGRCAINSAHYERAAPWLATAGSGDVLAGFITGLLARGFAPMAAAETAAWLHVECARKFGPGLIAEDLPEQLPAVFRDLGL